MDSHYFDIMHDSETDTYYGFPSSNFVGQWLKSIHVIEFDHGKKVVKDKFLQTLSQ
ncbi:hypothetical protein [Ornithobacterium rhinotracheale]|uniref:hypothetical protein n=1 Tax=Ornithobacterium rhinotracheale TaxID=28251 RepID=UPI001FF4F344|nr:hypothetical protein [Ornithobacterium rhinotracheale]MCK0206054.1 hypothetical protein [Ornithobacterium rhinotracheale]